jgi:hypothetical protein
MEQADEDVRPTKVSGIRRKRLPHNKILELQTDFAEVLFAFHEEQGGL